MIAEAAVLVSLYKARRFLAAKVENLLAQTIIRDCRVIFLNVQDLEDESELLGGLPDNCEIVKFHNHASLYQAWNAGIGLTKSRLITSSNVDDLQAPTYLAECVTALDRDQLDVVASDYLITDLPNQRWPKWEQVIGRVEVGFPGSTMGPCPVWKRDLHKAHGLFGDYQVIGDARAWETWAAAGHRFGAVRSDLALYYAGSESLERRCDPKTGVKLIDIDHAI